MPKGCQITATLRTRCGQGGPHSQIDVAKVGLIFKFQTRAKNLDGQYSTDLSFIFVFFFSFTCTAPQLIAGHIQKRKYRNNYHGNQQLFVFHFCILVVSYDSG